MNDAILVWVVRVWTVVLHDLREFDSVTTVENCDTAFLTRWRALHDVNVCHSGNWCVESKWRWRHKWSRKSLLVRLVWVSLDSMNRQIVKQMFNDHAEQRSESETKLKLVNGNVRWPSRSEWSELAVYKDEKWNCDGWCGDKRVEHTVWGGVGSVYLATCQVSDRMDLLLWAACTQSV